MRRILVTGASGQIGSELLPALRSRFGPDRVIGSDIRLPSATPGRNGAEGAFEFVDCTRPHLLHEVVRRHDIGTIYHLAALLSAVSEERPQIAWSVNMGGLYNVLEVARQHDCAVFFPSSIGAFGPSTPKEKTPQVTIQRPNTMYGVSKVSGELLCDYYVARFDVDARGLRLPGLISHVAPPGGGTTDYAVEIFRQAVRYRHYTCYLRADTRLDMMYMADALRAVIELMQADKARLTHRNAYNITAMSVTPADFATAIGRRLPGFEIDYEIDPTRQAIADSWPRAVDDTAARTDWGWAPEFDLDATCDAMLDNLGRDIGPARPP